MKLYVGGKCQGQEETARAENPGCRICTDFHETIRTACLNGEDARAFAKRFILENPDAIVVSDEVGSGIVPMTAEDRAFRENAGRALCVIAENSENVTRVVCGIPVRLK